MKSPPFRLKLPVWVMLLLFQIFLYSYCSAFNIEVKKAVLQKSDEHSSFGYSLDFYRDASIPGKPWFLMVGAPTDTGNIGKIRDTGFVYKCDVMTTLCKKISFDPEGNKMISTSNSSTLIQTDEKSKERFGSTVVSSKKGDKLVACAPHYTYFFENQKSRDPVGRCFYVDRSLDDATAFAPCLEETQSNYHRLGFGLCGHSAAIPESMNRVYVGAPGAYYSQGSVFLQNLRNLTDKPNTLNSTDKYDNTYLGFSTATGDFNNDGNDDVVVGIPRLFDCGAVRILSHKLIPIANLNDEDCQIGQQLGTAVAVTDLDGDGFADVIAGAPFYNDLRGKAQQKAHEKDRRYEIGKVVIFFQKTKGDFFAKKQTIYGDTDWSRFGYSVAAAGDLNQDGYNDFIVGAPYGGTERKGTVYVFHGSKNGVREKPTQIINAKDVSTNIKAFGFSLAGGKDIDGNQYPDIAVGAYKSGHAVIFRTKPVVRVNGEFSLRPASVNLETKSCAIDLGPTPCVDIDYTLRFEKDPRAPQKIELQVIAEVDAKMASNQRAFFYAKNLGSSFKPHDKAVSKKHSNIIEGTVTLKKGAELKRSLKIYVRNTIKDKLTPITVTLNYTLIEKITQFDQLDAALDTTVPTSFTKELKIDKNCGEDEKCIPDLVLSVEPKEGKFTVGSANRTVLNVTVKNEGEDAYESWFFITVPPEFQYESVANYADQPSKISCEKAGRTGDSQEYIFRCELGNPFPGGRRVKFGINLSAEKMSYTKDTIVIKTSVNSTNEEAKGRELDNAVNVTLTLETEAQLTLSSKSEPPEVVYSIRNATKVANSNAPDEIRANFDEELGPLVIHVYEVLNKGPSLITKARLDIIWPSHYLTGHHLLYLVAEPQVSSSENIVCRIKTVENFNPESLILTIGANSNRESPREQYEDYLGKRKVRHLNDKTLENKPKKRRLPQTANKTENINNSKATFNRAMHEGILLSKQHGGQAFAYGGYLKRTNILCSKGDCTHITCDIQDLGAEVSAVVSIYSRLVLNTVVELFHDVNEPYDVSSLAFAEVVEMPFKTGYKQQKQMLVVTTHLNPTDPEKSKEGIPWLFILLAALAGLLILLLLILCLWKCGFFKRKRPPTEHATYNTGARSQDTFADSQVRYAQPYMYSEEKHGDRL